MPPGLFLQPMLHGACFAMRANRLICLVILFGVSLVARAGADDAGDQYAVAAGHYARGQWKFAAEEFRTYLDRYPNHDKRAQATFFLAESLMQTGGFEASGRLFRECLATSADSKLARPALFRAGEAAYLAGDLAAAEVELSKFAGKYPDDKLNAYVLTYLGNIAHTNDDLAVAEKQFRQGLARFATSPLQDDYRFGLAGVLQKQGKHEEAERLYLAVAAKTASNLADDSQFHLGALQYADGRHAEAIESFDAFEHRFNGSPWLATARLGRGWALVKLERPDEAKAFFRLAASDPKVGTEARCWLGLTEKSQEDWSSAAQTLMEAAEADPKSKLVSALRFHAGDALLRDENPEAADRQFVKALAAAGDLDEWVDDAMRGRVQAATRLEDYETLDRVSAEFLRRFGDSTLADDMKRILARSLVERKKFAEAKPLLEALTTDGPGRESSADDRYLLSLAYQGLDRRQDALRTLSLVLDAADGQLKADAQRAKASLLVTMKRFEEAVEPLEAFRGTNPSGPEAVEAGAQLAVCYARSGRLDDAKQLHKELIAEHAEQEVVAQAVEQLAEAAYEAGDFSWSGRLFYWLSTEGRPHERELKGLSGLGWSQFKNGKLDEAQQTFNRLLEKDPDEELVAETALVCGQILEKLDRADPALAMFDRVVEQHPTSEQFSEALWAASRLRDELDQDREAASGFEKLIKECPDFPDVDAVLYHWAWALHDLGQSKEAADLFDRLHREHIESGYWADTTFRLAQTAFKDADYRRARELVDAVLAKKSNTPIRENLLYLSGQIAAADQNWDEARRAFEALTADHPKSALRWMAEYGIAESLFRQGDYATAAQRLRSLHKETGGDEQPWLAIVHLRLAQSLAHQKKWDEAFEIASKIEERFPGFLQQHEVDYVVGRCLANRADFEAAREAYAKAINSPAGANTETAAKAQLMVAESYYHQKSYEAALRDYLRLEILYAYPELQAAALLQAGKCHEQLGEWRQAVELYQRLLKDYPATESTADAESRMQSAKRRLSPDIRT